MKHFESVWRFVEPESVMIGKRFAVRRRRETQIMVCFLFWHYTEPKVALGVILVEIRILELSYSMRCENMPRAAVMEGGYTSISIVSSVYKGWMQLPDTLRISK